MGFRNLSRQVAPYAGFHVVHVRRGCADLQYGDRIHASHEPF